MSATSSLTASNTPTNSPPSTTSSPSPTPAEDALLQLSFVIAPVGSAALSSTAIYSNSSVLTAIKSSYATLLSIPIASVSIPTVTDVATGVITDLAALGLQSRRALGTPGSLGVAVAVRAILGKALSASSVASMQSVLANVPAAYFLPVLQAIVSTGGAASPSSLSARVDVATISFSNTAPAAVSTPSGPSSSSNSALIIGIGAGVGGIVLLVGVCCCFYYRYKLKRDKKQRKKREMQVLREENEELRAAVKEQINPMHSANVSQKWSRKNFDPESI